MQYLGMPKNPITCIFKTTQEIEYYIQIAFDNSDIIIKESNVS